MKEGIVGGQVYGFRYRATNRQGDGQYSDISFFKAANVPDQMVPVETTLLGVDLRIDWNAPNSGSLEIIGYLVEILTSDGSTYAQADTCDGSDPYIMSN